MNGAPGAEARWAGAQLARLLVGDVACPGERDFCTCPTRAVYQRRPRRRGRACPACGWPEPLGQVRFRLADGTVGWLELAEVAEALEAVS